MARSRHAAAQLTDSSAPLSTKINNSRRSFAKNSRTETHPLSSESGRIGSTENPKGSDGWPKKIAAPGIFNSSSFGNTVATEQLRCGLHLPKVSFGQSTHFTTYIATVFPIRRPLSLARFWPSGRSLARATMRPALILDPGPSKNLSTSGRILLQDALITGNSVMTSVRMRDACPNSAVRRPGDVGLHQFVAAAKLHPANLAISLAGLADQ